MSRDQDIQSHWKAIELTAAQWAQSHGIDSPVIPLSDLKAHWDAVVRNPNSTRDAVRSEALLAENLALRKELAVFKRRFGLDGNVVVVPPFLHADRGKAS